MQVAATLKAVGAGEVHLFGFAEPNAAYDDKAAEYRAMLPLKPTNPGPQ